MLIAIAAAAVALTQPPAPIVVDLAPTAKACATQLIQTDVASGKFDPLAPMDGGVERKPDRAPAFLVSAVDRKVDGCSVPVIRARAAMAWPRSNATPEVVKPVER